MRHSVGGSEIDFRKYLPPRDTCLCQDREHTVDHIRIAAKEVVRSEIDGMAFKIASHPARKIPS